MTKYGKGLKLRISEMLLGICMVSLAGGLRLLVNDFKATAKPETRQRRRAARRIVAGVGAAAMVLGVMGPAISVARSGSERKNRTVAAVRTALASPDALKATATCAEDIEKRIREITPPVASRTLVQPPKVPVTDYRTAVDLARANSIDCHETSGITGTWRVRVDDAWIAVTKETILHPPVS